MTKNEYVSKREELNKQLAALKEEYIRTNSPIPSGTKVKVIDGDGDIRYGILLGYACPWDNVEPRVAKINKDGTPHTTARLYVSPFSKIEVA